MRPFIFFIRKTWIFKKIPPQCRQSAYKFPSTDQRCPVLASAVRNKKLYDTIFNFRIRYHMIFQFPNKAKSGPLGATGSSVQCWPVLAGPSGCWGAGALGALSGTVNHLAHDTRFPDVDSDPFGNIINNFCCCL